MNEFEEESEEFEEESEEEIKTAEKKEEVSYKVTEEEELTIKIFVGLIMAGALVIGIGIVWAIADLIQPEGKFDWYLDLPIAAQTFFGALGILGIMFFGIFLIVFFRRGYIWILNQMYGQKPIEYESEEEYLPAKIIAGGMFFSILIIVVVIIIAFFQEYLMYADSTGFLEFLGQQSGGLRIISVGLIFQVIIWLILAVLYLWTNGYYFTMTYILRHNKEIEVREFEKKQDTVGKIIFIITVAAIIVIFFGIVYAIADAVQPEGKWLSFQDYSFGLQFSIIGTFGAVLFGLLVLSLMLYKAGYKLIMNALFVSRNEEVLNQLEEYANAKYFAWGILTAICLLIGSLVIWLISIGFRLEGTEIIFDLGELSGGLTMLFIGIMILTFDFLFLLFAYIYNNGYALMVDRVIKMEADIEKKIFRKKS